MWMSLLPGARDLRTPTAVGLTLAASLWVLIGSDLPRESEATGILLLMYRTVELVGSTAAMAMGAFIAYLLGSIVSEATLASRRVIARVLGHRWNYKSSRPRRRDLSAYRLLPGVLRRLQQLGPEEVKVLMNDPFAGTGLGHRVGFLSEHHTLRAGDGYTPSEGAVEQLGQTYAEAVAREVPSLETRLRIRSKELWDDFDRRKTEGEFRICMAVAVSLVVAALAVEFSWWFVLAAAVPVLLFIQGSTLLERANLVIAEAIVHEVMDSPTLAVLDRRIHAMA